MNQRGGFGEGPPTGCPDKNVVGNYTFSLPDLGEGGFRPLRDPDAQDDEMPA